MAVRKKDWTGPPVAPTEAHEVRLHGRVLDDPYHWMKQRDDPRVSAYLEAENAYTDARMAHTLDLQNALYREMLARIEETDMSVPYRKGAYVYFTRTEQGKQYPIYYRRLAGSGAEEEILLDPNQLAQGNFFKLGVFEVSPDHRRLAYSVDESGAEVYRLIVIDLENRQVLDEIEGTSYSVEWANDNRTLFYTTVDDSNRPYRLYRHQVGSEDADVLVFEESDEAFFLDVSRTRSGAFLFLSLESRVTSEVYYLSADRPCQEFALIAQRRNGIEYALAHRGDFFYITTNEKAENFRLMRAPVADLDPALWKEIVPHHDSVLLEGIELFEDFLAIFERRDGTTCLRILDLRHNQFHPIEFPEILFTVAAGTNEEFQSSKLRLRYSSFATPETIYDLDMVSGQLKLLKQMPVKGDFDSQDYRSERLTAQTPDGEAIPISLVRRKESAQSGTEGPLLLYAYGAYGACMDPTFSSVRLSLLDRGISFAVAHVRGGEELGRRWYRTGKLKQKKNTFEDFICCAEYLIKSGYTSPRQLVMRGGSAGGLLVGAVLNARPDLFRAAIADVPFVDIINTMLDPSIPLTVIEYEEWGNPALEEDFETMLSYSPYDNVKAQEYPHLLVRAGLNDRRVAYWEPAKWVARLRHRRTDQKLLLLKTLMGAGHGGASGRYDRLKDAAFDYAFILDRLGMGSQRSSGSNRRDEDGQRQGC